MNLAFFGTSDRSIPILQALKENFDLKLCITKTDTLVGRKQEKRETKVKSWAIENNIDFIEVASLKGDYKDKVINALKQCLIDVAMVADFSFIIPQEVIDIPKYKIINIHFSLLPRYRGASPVQHAILNGEKETGITYYIVDKGMDTGDIIYQSKYVLSGRETSDSLYTTLFTKAAEEIPTVIKKYVNKELRPQVQKHEDATYCYSKTNPKATFIDKADAEIDWSQPIEKIEQSIRAFNPWPIAWTSLAELGHALNLKYKNSVNVNLKVKIIEASKHENSLNITKLQIEGKNPTDFISFKNGYTE